MLTIKQALEEMDLAEDLKSEIKQYPLDSALELTQENKFIVILRTSENETWFRKNEIYDKIYFDSNVELTDEELEITSDDFPVWNPCCCLGRGTLADNKNITTLDLSHLIPKLY